jgi:hypothetical protein
MSTLSNLLQLLPGDSYGLLHVVPLPCNAAHADFNSARVLFVMLSQNDNFNPALTQIERLEDLGLIQLVGVPFGMMMLLYSGSIFMELVESSVRGFRQGSCELTQPLASAGP